MSKQDPQEWLGSVRQRELYDLKCKVGKYRVCSGTGNVDHGFYSIRRKDITLDTSLKGRMKKQSEPSR